MYSVNQIHNTMLNNIDDAYQKTEGFPTYDLTRGVAYGQYQVWKKAFEIEEKQDVENLTDGELDKFVYQRAGLERKKAVKAKGYIRIVTGEGRIDVGDIFESESGVQFESRELKVVYKDSLVYVEAINAGSSGNLPQGCITQMPVTIQGIGAIINDLEMAGGYDDENDNDLRQRYYEFLQIPATCGNKYHYIAWAKEVDGVGGAKCIPCWQGKNTVKVVVIGNDCKPADETLIESVQSYIDPNKNGYGEGTAPVGAVCTVVSAEKIVINISVNINLASNVEDEEATKEDIYEKLDSYIRSLAFKSNRVSYGRAGATILDCEGVIDYDSLEINGQKGNIEIGEYEVAVLNEVNVNVNSIS